MTVAEDAIKLLKQESYGVLSTHSLEMEGFPFGSIVPYCQDHGGEVTILISRLAQHTKNLMENGRCSLLVADSVAGDKQTAGRLTLMCEAEKVEPEAIASRFYRYFPSNQGYHDQLDFDFYRLTLVKARYIAGFGKIHWIGRDSFLRSSPFEEQAEAGIVNHMNEDHLDAIRHYCDLFGIPVDSEQQPTLAGIDGEGMHLRVGDRLHRIQFERNISNPKEAREILVELARAPI